MIKIETKKSFINGFKERKILKINGSREEELPEAYLREEIKNIYLVDDPFSFKSNYKDCGYRYIMVEGGIYKEETFERKIEFIKECGKNLHKINQEIKETSWKGEETFII